MPTNGELLKIRALRALLVSCPTCGKDLVQRPGTSIVECPDLYHGRFVIMQNTKGGFSITYELKAQALKA